VWRQGYNQEIKGMDKFLKRTEEGRKQTEARMAAKDDRFGVVKQVVKRNKKTGEEKVMKVVNKRDVGQTTVS
jgi:hypothetical protein